VQRIVLQGCLTACTVGLLLGLGASFAGAQQLIASAPDVSTAAPAPLVDAPAPSDSRPVEPYPTNLYQAPWSRIGVGGDISPLGIGIKSAVVLNTFMDARLNINFFQFSDQFDVDGFSVQARLHLDSAAAMVDAYPWASVWRVSAGLMFLNGNQLSGLGTVAPGTEITIDGQDFYSARSSAATGATPVTGTGILGFDRHPTTLILSGGFGKFIPRSERHWSFPSEFGVIFTGSPTINLKLQGWVCANQALTECSSLANSANPVTIQFNNSLNATLDKWRRDLNRLPIYPVFSYSAVYSFDTPWSR
jgi:hypothetical protein